MAVFYTMHFYFASKVTKKWGKINKAQELNP